MLGELVVRKGKGSGSRAQGGFLDRVPRARPHHPARSLSLADACVAEL